jgi:DNA-directed RNA polymerase omega subunit
VNFTGGTILEMAEETTHEKPESKRSPHAPPSTLVLVEEMTRHIPNKYEAVRAIAKEARNINSMYLMHNLKEEVEKPTTFAIKRALQGKLSFAYEEEEAEVEEGEEESGSDDEEKAEDEE